MSIVTDLDALRVPVPKYEGDCHALRPLAERMYKAMTSKHAGVRGIGLSANQVGEAVRMFVMLTTPRPAGFHAARVCVNPKFVPASGAQLKSSLEMCLSLPGKEAKVLRYDSIVAAWLDLKGTLRTTTLHGVSSRCFQHELDHLNGITLLDAHKG